MEQPQNESQAGLPQRREDLHPIERKQALINEIKRMSLQPGVPPDRFIPAFYQMVAEIVSAQGGSLWFYEFKDEKLMCRVDGMTREGMPAGPDSETVSKTVLQAIKNDNSILVLPDQAESDLAKALGKDSGIDSLSAICVPFEIDNQTWAALFFYGDTAVRRFDSSDVYLCKTLATYLNRYCLFWNNQQLTSRVEKLDSLVKVSGELTSSLNPDEISYAIANLSGQVVKLDRTTVAIMKRDRAVVSAISGQDLVQKKSALVKLISNIATHVARRGDVMAFSRETADNIEDQRLKRMVQRYYDDSRMETMVAVPLRDQNKPIAVLLFERKDEKPFDSIDMSVIQSVATHSLVALKNALQYHRLPMVKTLERLARVKESVGKLPKVKLALYGAAICAAIYALFYVQWDFRISGDGEVKPMDKRVVTASVAGQIKDVLVDVNEDVEKGQIIAQLDDSDLQKELLVAQAQRNAKEQERYGAKTAAERRIIEKEIEVIDSRIDHIKAQIEKTKIKAPISGTIVTPRVKELRGRMVQPGVNAICEIATLKDLNLLIYVDEDDVRYIEQGQNLKFIFAGTKERMSTVREISAESTLRENRNVFTVTAKIDDPSGLKPGMTGPVYVYIDKRPLWFIWFRKIIDFARLHILF